MTKYEKLAITISLVIVIVGLLFGLYTEGVNFSRAGALVVIVGIVYGLLDLPSKLTNIDSWARGEAEKVKPSVLESLKDQGADNKKAEGIYKKTIDEAIEEINWAAQKRKRKLVLVGGAILIVGTLIWGFGDLVNPVYCTTS